MFRAALLLWHLLAAVAAQTEQPDGKQLLATYCLDCHAGDDAAKDLQLELLLATEHHPAGPSDAQIALALQRLASQTMPPPTADAPTTAERLALRRWLAARLPANADQQRPVVRRLSRREYERSIAALFGLAIDANELLPEDAPGHGFANLGDAAHASPLAMEKYHSAAVAIAAVVVDDPKARHSYGPSSASWLDLLPALLPAAFRRPVTDDELSARRELHQQLRSGNASATLADQALLQSILLSPHFLFRLEHSDPRHPGEISDAAIAVRLAYTLTGGPPDARLREEAAAGLLRDPAARAATARRLLASDDGRNFAEGFFAEWLGLADALQANADFRRYPQIWQQQLRPHFREEALQLVQAMLRDDLPITTLVDADFSYLSRELAEHYELPAPTAPGFQRVQLPDRRRGGLLGMGAMLLPTSTPLRTSPVQRGRWILDRLLAQSIPPPPPNVGSLPADDKPQGKRTLRERLERHRSSRSCASCHAVMDPLGFALENYDVLGRWRDELHGRPIDSRGELPGGTTIDGPIALRDILLQRRDELALALAKNLLVYATGRAYTVADEEDLLAIAAQAAAGDYRIHDLLAAVFAARSFVAWPAIGDEPR